MVRLIDKLVRRGSHAPLAVNEPCIIGDEQLAYIDSLPDDHPKWRAEDFPNMAPPFRRMWIEAKSRVADVDYGVWVTEFVPRLVSNREYYKVFWPWATPPARIRWIMGSVCYLRQAHDYYILPQMLLMFIGPEGQILNPNHPETGQLLQGLSQPYPFLAQKLKLQMMLEEHGLNVVPFALRTWAMMNCVNVEMIEVAPPEKLSKSHQKKYGVPMSTWRELTLKTRKYARSEAAASERDESGERRHYREHLVRGHFKRRKNGVFWWGSHFRGRHEMGTIRKSYNVQ